MAGAKGGMAEPGAKLATHQQVTVANDARTRWMGSVLGSHRSKDERPRKVTDQVEVTVQKATSSPVQWGIALSMHGDRDNFLPPRASARIK